MHPWPEADSTSALSSCFSSAMYIVTVMLMAIRTCPK
jgi:hypothetical protein